MNTLYLYDVTKGFLYRLSGTYVKSFLKKFPNWREEDGDGFNDYLEEVKGYFAKYGKVIATDRDKNVRATF